MTTLERPPAADHGNELGNLIAEDAPQFDALCRLTPRVSEAIAAHPIMRMLIPGELGGKGTGVLGWFRAAREISEMDGSAGWVAGQNSASLALLALNAEPSFRQLLLEHPASNASTSAVSEMDLRAIDDRHVEISGCWHFCSGVTTARWVAGIVRPAEEAIEMHPGAPYVAIETHLGHVRENWNSVGLRGTGSHDYVVDKLIVPRERIVWLLGGEQGAMRYPSSPIGHSAVLITLAAAAVQVGVARRALDLARDYLLNKSRAPMAEGTLIDDPSLFTELAAREGDWEMSNAAVEMACVRFDEAIATGDGWHTARISARQVSVAAIHQCAEIVSAALRLGGSEASTRGARLEQCFRDGNVLTTHVAGRTRLLSQMLRVTLGRSDSWDHFAL